MKWKIKFRLFKGKIISYLRKQKKKEIIFKDKQIRMKGKMFRDLKISKMFFKGK